MTTPRPPIVTCFGGGGAFGVGFNHGVATGLAERGIDVSQWPMLGTSAGSHTAGMLDLGLSFDEVADHWDRGVGAETKKWGLDGHRLVSGLLGDRRGVNASAATVRLWGLKRVVLSSPEYRIADMVAASSAIAPIAKPHRIGRYLYLDGGVRSMASADLAPAADLLLLITPFALDSQGPAGWMGRRQAVREMTAWSDQHGGDVLHVVPSEEMAALGGSKLREVTDMRIGRAVHPLAVELGRHVADYL